MSYHNMRGFGGAGSADSKRFDDWLSAAVTKAPGERDDLLRTWSNAPSARASHPREEQSHPAHGPPQARLEKTWELACSVTHRWGRSVSAVRFG
ncbi:MAG: hypothetical protein WDN08_04705 [Rhizomicrobium sp.]